MLAKAIMKLNTPMWSGTRDDPVPGGVTWWFKQDEIHWATHVHGGLEFLPWHRQLINQFEDLLRVIDRRLSLHYWDWTQDPRNIPSANLGNGHSGDLSLFEDLGDGVTDRPAFMGYGGATIKPIGPKWQAAGFYDPNANPFRVDHPNPHHPINNNPADKPRIVERKVAGSPADRDRDDEQVLKAKDYPQMTEVLEPIHDTMHSFVFMGDRHISFRDPFVFLLHSNVDRLFAQWQAKDPDRLLPDGVYGTATNDPALNGNIEPWSTGHTIDTESGTRHVIRPWCEPELLGGKSLGLPITYKDPSIVTPPRYEHPS